jgi:hypothetical protein
MSMNSHCWHDYGPHTGADRSEICCFCGLKYEPHLRVPLLGHGEFSPDRTRPAKPAGPCPKAGKVDLEDKPKLGGLTSDVWKKFREVD